jgi:hypothetical protein
LGINLKGYRQENQEFSYSSHGNAYQGKHVVNFGKAISFSVSNDLMNCIVLLYWYNAKDMLSFLNDKAPNSPSMLVLEREKPYEVCCH